MRADHLNDMNAHLENNSKIQSNCILVKAWASTLGGNWTGATVSETAKTLP